MYQDVLRGAESALTAYPTLTSIISDSLLHGQVPSWSVKPNSREKLEIYHTPLQKVSPFISECFSCQQGNPFPYAPFGSVSNKLIDLNLPNLAEKIEFQDTMHRLKDSPFKLRVYTDDKILSKNKMDKNNVLTLLKGELITELLDGATIIKTQYGQPGEIIVGQKREAGDEHRTKIEKNSIILYRQDGNTWNASPSTFRNDLIFVYAINAIPFLTSSAENRDSKLVEFNIKWYLYGTALEDLHFMSPCRMEF